MEINTFSHLKTSRRLARMQPFSYLGMQFADVKRIFLKDYAHTLTSGLVAQESSENPLCRDSKQLQVLEKNNAKLHIRIKSSEATPKTNEPSG